jgi:hypothetical protein
MSADCARPGCRVNRSPTPTWPGLNTGLRRTGRFWLPRSTVSLADSSPAGSSKMTTLPRQPTPIALAISPTSASCLDIAAGMSHFGCSTASNSIPAAPGSRAFASVLLPQMRQARATYERSGFAPYEIVHETIIPTTRKAVQADIRRIMEIRHAVRENRLSDPNAVTAVQFFSQVRPRAGHFAGHHGLIGAAAGCAIGHHEANKHQNTQPATTGSASRSAPK